VRARRLDDERTEKRRDERLGARCAGAWLDAAIAPKASRVAWLFLKGGGGFPGALDLPATASPGFRGGEAEHLGTGVAGRAAAQVWSARYVHRQSIEYPSSQGMDGLPRVARRRRALCTPLRAVRVGRGPVAAARRAHGRVEGRASCIPSISWRSARTCSTTRTLGLSST
jgi:hypothetical protein